MRLGFVGRKVGMMRIFNEDGSIVPVTVLDCAGNRVTQIKSVDVDGYCAIQIAYGKRRASRVTKAMAGHFANARASYERSIALDANYAVALLNLGILYDLYLWDGARALELYDRYLQLTPGGDEQVKRWVSDLRNRSAQKSAPQRKEQG